ncbi:MAG: hypothetical protein DRJ01_11920 [Bacteroidetes bacterium]|nr:MAG: hypothetical protein DRJ01_11920 [Bacteroidota bacterium]
MEFKVKKTFLVLFIFSYFTLFSQTFKINDLKSLSYLTIIGFIDISNNYFDKQIIADLNEKDLEYISKNDVPFFDRIAFQKYSLKLKHYSDYAVYLTIVSLIIVYNKEYFRTNLLVYSEVLLTQSAIAKWTKTIAKRKRPFVYDKNVSDKKKNERNSQHSFYSMHSSTAFASATFAYYYYLDNWGKNIPIAFLLYGSATASAALRVVSENHFPSDVLAGAIVGTTIGYLICKYHDSKKIKIRLSYNKLELNFPF